MLNNTAEESNNNKNNKQSNCFLSVLTELGSSCVKRFQSKIENYKKKLKFTTFERKKGREWQVFERDGKSEKKPKKYQKKK